MESIGERREDATHIYVYVFIYNIICHRVKPTARGHRENPALPAPWPIQDILSLVFVCARTNHPLITLAH